MGGSGAVAPWRTGMRGSTIVRAGPVVSLPGTAMTGFALIDHHPLRWLACDWIQRRFRAPHNDPPRSAR